MRFRGVCFRAHDPRWSFKPVSGDGAAIRGGRFNPQGVPALYLALEIVTAIKEVGHGFARRIDPLVLCSYDVDCDGIVDLRTDEGRRSASVSLDDMACGWMDLATRGSRPPSWTIFERLALEGAAGILIPSFAVGADDRDANLVLWTWGRDRPHRVEVFDPSGRLPKNQLSWD